MGLTNALHHSMSKGHLSAVRTRLSQVWRWLLAWLPPPPSPPHPSLLECTHTSQSQSESLQRDVLHVS